MASFSQLRRIKRVAAKQGTLVTYSLRLNAKLGEVKTWPQNSAKNASKLILAEPAITTRRANVRKLLTPIRSPTPPARHQRTKRKKRVRVEAAILTRRRKVLVSSFGSIVANKRVHQLLAPENALCLGIVPRRTPPVARKCS